MREIKFRAWNEKHSDPKYKMMYDVWLTGGGNVVMPDGDAWEIPLMQYTGLKDKNKKECYEKDYGADGNMIDWCDRCCGYQFFQIDIPTKDVIFCHNCDGNFMVQDHIPDFEIIGNVYENPELLNQNP